MRNGAKTHEPCLPILFEVSTANEEKKKKNLKWGTENHEVNRFASHKPFWPKMWRGFCTRSLRHTCSVWCFKCVVTPPLDSRPLQPSPESTYWWQTHDRLWGYWFIWCRVTHREAKKFDFFREAKCFVTTQVLHFGNAAATPSLDCYKILPCDKRVWYTRHVYFLCFKPAQVLRLLTDTNWSYDDFSGYSSHLCLVPIYGDVMLCKNVNRFCTRS